MSDRLTFTLHELVAEIDAYADSALRARHGVSFSLFEFLAVLSDVQPADMTTLARCLGVTKAAVSKRVPPLVDQGWVHAAPGVGRSVDLSLTDRGSALVQVAGDELESDFAAVFTQTLDGAHSLDIPTLNRQLVALTAQFQRTNAAPDSTGDPS